MKKLLIICVLLVLGACTNPFDKYQESFDAIGAAGTLATEVGDIQTIIDSLPLVNGVPDLEALTPADVQNLISSLDTINENLDNPQVQAILTSYAEQYNVSLDTDVSGVQTQLENIDITDADGDGNTTNETQIATLLTSILGKI